MKSLLGLEAIEGLNLDVIAARMTRKRGWTKQRTLSAIAAYKDFLRLQLQFPGTDVQPSEDADEIWHAHLLHSQKYREDCDDVFGHFLDHVPSDEASETCFGGSGGKRTATCFGGGKRSAKLSPV